MRDNYSADDIDGDDEGPDAAELAMNEDGFGSYDKWRPVAPIAHPSMRPTREHLAANRLPQQRNRRAS